MGQSFACTSTYLDPRILEFVESQIQSWKILVVSKTRCTACKRAKQLLRDVASKTGVDIRVFEVDKYELQCTKGIMKYLSAQTGINTVPQIYINGRFVGGNDDIQRLHLQNRLVSLVMQPMKPKPIRSSFNGNGFRPSSSIRVSAFQTDILPAPTFDIIPARKSNPIISEQKSDEFFYYKTGSDRRRRSSTSTIASVNSSIAFTNENNWIVPSRRRSISSTPVVLSSTHVPTRRRSLSSIPVFSSTHEEIKWDTLPVKPNKLVRSRSAPSIDSVYEWQGVGSVSTVHNDFNEKISSISNYHLLRDEATLSQPARVVASQRDRWVTPRTEYVVLPTESGWMPNLSKDYATTAVTSVDSVGMNSGSNGWLNISTVL